MGQIDLRREPVLTLIFERYLFHFHSPSAFVPFVILRSKVHLITATQIRVRQHCLGWFPSMLGLRYARAVCPLWFRTAPAANRKPGFHTTDKRVDAPTKHIRDELIKTGESI